MNDEKNDLFTSLGATTGRTRSDQPNVSNAPRAAEERHISRDEVHRLLELAAKTPPEAREVLFTNKRTWNDLTERERREVIDWLKNCCVDEFGTVLSDNLGAAIHRLENEGMAHKAWMKMVQEWRVQRDRADAAELRVQQLENAVADEPLVMRMARSLGEESQFFESLRERLWREAPNQYVLIKGKELIGITPTAEEGLEEGYKRYGTTGFLMKKITEKDEPIFIGSVLSMMEHTP